MHTSDLSPEHDSLSPILDQRVLSQFKPPVVQRLIGIFFEQAPELISDIKKAAIQEDAGTMGKHAHKFKGSCLVLGAKALAEVCDVLQIKGQNDDLSDVDNLIKQLEQAYENTYMALEKLK